MNAYEVLILEAESKGINIFEIDFDSDSKGLCNGNKIAIDKTMTVCEKKCILAEELGHFYTTVGNILDQTNPNNARQERRARAWAIEKILPIDEFIKAVKHGCYTTHEVADFLDVDECFLYESIDHYKRKLGTDFKLIDISVV